MTDFVEYLMRMAEAPEPGLAAAAQSMLQGLFKVEDSPRDVENTERLMRYWSEGEGAAKIRWGEGGDYNRCLLHLGKYVGDDKLHGLCANLHHRALGIWPATHAKEEREK